MTTDGAISSAEWEEKLQRDQQRSRGRELALKVWDTENKTYEAQDPEGDSDEEAHDGEGYKKSQDSDNDEDVTDYTRRHGEDDESDDEPDVPIN